MVKSVESFIYCLKQQNWVATEAPCTYLWMKKLQKILSAVSQRQQTAFTTSAGSMAFQYLDPLVDRGCLLGRSHRCNRIFEVCLTFENVVIRAYLPC